MNQKEHFWLHIVVAVHTKKIIKMKKAIQISKHKQPLSFITSTKLKQSNSISICKYIYTELELHQHKNGTYNVVVTMGAHHLQQFNFMKSFIKRWLPCPWGVWWKPIFFTHFCKKNRGMKMGCHAPFAKLFRKINSFKWWLPKVTKSIRKGMLELDCWTMRVVFTWEDDELDIQCVPVHPVVSHGFQGLTI